MDRVAASADNARRTWRADCRPASWQQAFCSVAGLGPRDFPVQIDAEVPGLGTSGYMTSKHQPSQRETKTGGQAQFGALLMTDGGAQRSGPPSLFHGLTEAEIAQVLGSGKRRVLY